MKLNGCNPTKLSYRVVEFILTRDIADFESLNVNSIAREFKINRSYLSQRFKRDIKYSLHEYILMIKILRSLTLLEIRENRITIEDLSQKMGFSGSDYFRRVFKQKMGITPGKYRNLFKKGKLSKDPPIKKKFFSDNTY
jgi:AraC-like DNA-binding protein